jgi:hypothetical protein
MTHKHLVEKVLDGLEASPVAWIKTIQKRKNLIVLKKSQQKNLRQIWPLRVFGLCRILCRIPFLIQPHTEYGTRYLSTALQGAVLRLNVAESSCG